jgi:MPBQ/MSBQ methyltransferase
MDGNSTALIGSAECVIGSFDQAASLERVIEFYEEASMDYAHWSHGLNMHIGFYRGGLNPFDREAMFEQLNLEVASRLQLGPEDHAFLIDLGCGMGAVARTVARYYKNSTIKGVTIAPSQVRIASKLNARQGLDRRIEILRADYTNMPFKDSEANGVFAVESACYAEGPAKEKLIHEMARVLGPGGRFVIADCFVMRPEKEFGTLLNLCYRAACRNWAVTEMCTLENVVATLEKHGFGNIIVEDISWRAAPSVAHTPFAVFTFILEKLLTGRRLRPHTLNNLKASLLAPILGISRHKFRYCLISGMRM